MALFLFVSDLHGNFDALRSVLARASYDTVFCLGDLVDYGPEPAECIDWVRRNNVATVRGNHDNAVAFKVDCGCGYVYKRLSVATREYTWASLGDNDISFLKGLPLLIEKEIDGFKFVLAHGSPRSFFDYLYPDTPEDHLVEMAGDISCDYLCVGHTHKPATFLFKGMKILNPGSVGQPRDGDSRASCLVLDTATGETRVIRVKYDIEATCKKIRDKMPLAPELELILKRGY